MIKLIASDLDGTLLTDKKELTDKTRKVLYEAYQRGITIVPATGRGFESVPDMIRGLPGVEYLITSNGGAIYSVSQKKRIYERPLDPESVDAVLALPLPDGMALEIFIQGVPYAEKKYVEDPAAYGATGYGVRYVQTTRRVTEDVRAFAAAHREEIDSISVVCGGEEGRDRLWPSLTAAVPKASVTSSVPHLLEIIHEDAGKGKTLLWLLKHLGISPQEAMAFGDADNDISMLTAVKYGFAVANATEACRRAAPYHTNTNEEDGVVCAIRSVWQEQEVECLSLLDTEPDCAMEYLVGAYTGLICHEASKYLSNPEDVKDCVNDTFLEVYHHRASYDKKKGSLAVWIASIARHRAISAYRKAARVPVGFGNSLEAVPEETDRIAEAEDAFYVEQALGMMSEGDQELLRMKYYQGMSISEIAASLHIPYETAKKRHTRSLKKLRRIILLLLIAGLLLLAGCGIAKLLQYYGIIPGVGLVTQTDLGSGLLDEEVSEDTEAYHAAVTAAVLSDGELDVDYEFWLCGQERVEDDGTNLRGLQGECSITLEDGTPLDYPDVYSPEMSVGDSFYSIGTARGLLDEETLEKLSGQGKLSFVLAFQNITYEGESCMEDLFLPFTVKLVNLESIDDFPHVYSEEAGGLILDPVLDGSTLSLNVYTLPGTDWEYSKGLDRDFYSGATDDPDDTPVTIVSADGETFLGDFPVDVAVEAELEGTDITPYQYSTRDYYRGKKSGYSTFIFEGITPGTYTLKLPYIYYLAFGDYGILSWNLEDGTFSDEAISIPGGKMYTVSIERTDAWSEVTEEKLDEFWEVRVRCELDREDLTVVETSYPFEMSEPKKTLAYQLETLFGEDTGGSGIKMALGGRLDEETGELVYQIGFDERYRETHDLSHVEVSPAINQNRPIVYRYEHPLEISFEVE